MHIFLSWSGRMSNAIAAEMKDLIEQVLPGNDIYLSNQEITSGERWVANIGKNLDECSYGLVFLTPFNKDAPWILFESGALSKSFDSSRVVPVLHGISDSDLTSSPLGQFQNRKLEKDEILQLILDINNISERPIAPERVTRSFEAFWPETDAKLQDAFTLESQSKRGQSKPSQDDKIDQLQQAMSEILKIVRINQADVTGRNLLSSQAVEVKRHLPPPGQRIYVDGFEQKYYIFYTPTISTSTLKRTSDRKLLGRISNSLGMDEIHLAAAAMIRKFESQDLDKA